MGRGLVLVAPYYTDLGLSEVRRSGFVQPPWDWPRIRANATAIGMFHSENDPYISQDEFEALARHLNADVNLFRGVGHFAELTAFDALVQHVIRYFR